jgi:hypothetical protein
LVKPENTNFSLINTQALKPKKFNKNHFLHKHFGLHSLSHMEIKRTYSTEKLLVKNPSIDIVFKNRKKQCTNRLLYLGLYTYSYIMLLHAIIYIFFKRSEELYRFGLNDQDCNHCSKESRWGCYRIIGIIDGCAYALLNFQIIDFFVTQKSLERIHKDSFLMLNINLVLELFIFFGSLILAFLMTNFDFPSQCTQCCLNCNSMPLIKIINEQSITLDLASGYPISLIMTRILKKRMRIDVDQFRI